ncbi:mCG1028680, partial [Mus musculus]
KHTELWGRNSYTFAQGRGVSTDSQNFSQAYIVKLKGGRTGQRKYKFTSLGSSAKGIYVVPGGLYLKNVLGTVFSWEGSNFRMRSFEVKKFSKNFYS